MGRPVRKLLRELCRVADKYGFRFVGNTGASHYRFERDGVVITTAQTPTNDDITIRNFQRDLRRASR